MSNRRSVAVTVEADVAPYVKSMEAAAKVTEQLADAQEKASKKIDEGSDQAKVASAEWGKVSTGLVVAGGAAIGLGLALPIKKFADFDAAMAGVAATGPDARARLSELAIAARESATDVNGAGYAATEAAAGIEALVKAGVSVDDVMGGGLAGTLALAAAGQMDVAAAAEAASGAMTQFGLAGEDVTHIADLLAAGAGKPRSTDGLGVLSVP